MLHRVEVDVVDVPLEILVVADGVFPISTLPDFSLAVFTTPGTDAALSQRCGEATFDHPPPHRVTIVAVGKLPHAMQVIRQHHGRDDVERMACADLGERAAQQVNVVNQQAGGSIRERECEEIRTAWHEIAAIENHADSIAMRLRRRYRARAPRLGQETPRLMRSRVSLLLYPGYFVGLLAALSPRLFRRNDMGTSDFAGTTNCQTRSA